MSTSPILTYGFGSFGSINQVPTLGFSASNVATIVQRFSQTLIGISEASFSLIGNQGKALTLEGREGSAFIGVIKQ